VRYGGNLPAAGFRATLSRMADILLVRLMMQALNQAKGDPWTVLEAYLDVLEQAGDRIAVQLGSDEANRFMNAFDAPIVDFLRTQAPLPPQHEGRTQRLARWKRRPQKSGKKLRALVIKAAAHAHDPAEVILALTAVLFAKSDDSLLGQEHADDYPLFVELSGDLARNTTQYMRGLKPGSKNGNGNGNGHGNGHGGSGQVLYPMRPSGMVN